MSGFCADSGDDAKCVENDFYSVCFICQLDLKSLASTDLKEAHLNSCMNAMENKAASVQELSKGEEKGTFEANGQDVDLSDFHSFLTENSDDCTRSGLRAKEFSCIICDLDLSRRCITARCQHLKRCSRQNGIGIRDLLQMLSPVDHRDSIMSMTQQVIDEVHELSSDEEGTSSLPVRDASSVMMGAARRKWGDSTSSTPAAPPPPPSATSVLMANARLKWSSTAAVTDKSSGGGRKRKGVASLDSQATETETRFCPQFKKVMQGSHMTKPIIVDGFNYSSAELSDCYFLTHFHSDHYGGLTKHFNHGNIYCSPSTCSLVKLKLNVRSRFLHALSLDKKHTVMCDGVPVEVTLTDANHCPGAVLILFQFPSSGGGAKTVLHTGDFRFGKHMLDSSRVLRQLASDPARNSKQLVVYLDTTYCDPSHRFPAQEDCLVAVRRYVAEDIAARELQARTGLLASSSLAGGGVATGFDESTLYVFGAYGIGKERVFMSVAKMMDKKVFVEKPKWKMMLCFDWSTEDLSRLTATDPDSTNIWVVPMNHINFKSLETIKAKKKGCKRVVAFQPTGWTFTRTKSKGSCGAYEAEEGSTTEPLIQTRSKGGIVIHSVPYSEHSSFLELVEFVETFKPHHIIPTVNTSKDKVKTQLNFLRESLKRLDQASEVTGPPPGDESRQCLTSCVPNGKSANSNIFFQQKEIILQNEFM